MTPSGILLSVTILLSIVYESTCIHCFYCNSANNSACIDPSQLDDELRGRIIPIINCDIAVPRVAEYDFFCRKIVQTIYHPRKDSEIRVTRGCGWVRHEKPCYRADNSDHLETVCQCFTDHCNSADNVSASTATALFVAFAICLYYYR
ncbi:uncharacterized protein LOC113500086 [Trichoplusia ni]|uniref:Uncharacterized protein LOC113500086 n=1 Tax=Trichoplusia ni TaxID=7111 RepID=A0A7E5W7S7_TRINI|nr:uncharacterized protein LOC113500086 [Trichoplusia ni]XP_026736558.1 uncharacterized protein LOC113500086 [Trichoplusia ni]